MGIGAEGDCMQDDARLALAVQQVGLGTMVEAVQQVIAVAAHFIDMGLSLLFRQAQQDQGMGGQHQAGLKDLGDHLGSTGCLQVGQVGIITGAYQDRHAGGELAGTAYGLQRMLGIVGSDHYQAGALGAEGSQ